MKLALITGSAGFIGTNLCKKLLSQNYAIIGIDNFSSSEQWKSKLFENNDNYEFIEGDINHSILDILGHSRLLKKLNTIDEIYNLACPASPPRYRELSLETINVCTTGTKNVLEVAKRYNARLLHASTSEVYGDPLEHPQKETYRGNVNTIGARSCYDEGKRIAETICYEYRRLFDLDIKIVRIFNTYGPYMDPLDGRVITNFIHQALGGTDITVYGDGLQTRSFQYIDDLLTAFEKLMNQAKNVMGPVNIGNPNEFTVVELAKEIVKLTNSSSKIVKIPPTEEYVDDPKVRKPDIRLAQNLLKWYPEVQLREGLLKTLEYYIHL